MSHFIPLTVFIHSERFELSYASPMACSVHIYCQVREWISTFLQTRKDYSIDIPSTQKSHRYLKTFKPTLWAAVSHHGSRVVFVLRRRAVTPDELWSDRRTLELCLELHFSTWTVDALITSVSLLVHMTETAASCSLFLDPEKQPEEEEWALQNWPLHSHIFLFECPNQLLAKNQGAGICRLWHFCSCCSWPQIRLVWFFGGFFFHLFFKREKAGQWQGQKSSKAGVMIVCQRKVHSAFWQQGLAFSVRN